MLPLIRTTDRVRLVCSTDPSVTPHEGERLPHRWLTEDEADNDGGALVAIMRPFSETERMRVLAKVQRCRTSAPAEDETPRSLTPQEVADSLEQNADFADTMATVVSRCAEAFEPEDLGTPEEVVSMMPMAEVIALGHRMVLESTAADPTSAGGSAQ